MKSVAEQAIERSLTLNRTVYLVQPKQATITDLLVAASYHRQDGRSCEYHGTRNGKLWSVFAKGNP